MKLNQIKFGKTQLPAVSCERHVGCRHGNGTLPTKRRGTLHLSEVPPAELPLLTPRHS